MTALTVGSRPSPWIYAANKLQQIVGPDTTIGLTPTLDSTLRQKPANI